MALHLVTGKANAGKSGVVNARLFEALSSGGTPTLVLPSVAEARRATSELAGKSPVGIAVASWDQWFQAAWSLYGDGRRLISPAVRAALVDQAIEVAGVPELPLTPGLRSLIGDAVSHMSQLPESLAGPSTALDYVLHVCSTYERITSEQGLVETTRALVVLASSTPPILGLLAFNRFPSLTGAQLDLLVCLSRTSEVVVALTWESDFVPAMALDAAVGRLSAFAERVDHELEPESTDEIPRLSNALYASAGVPARGSVIMATADGEEAEAALIAKYAREAVLAGTPADRIVIAFPRLDRQADQVLGALHASGLEAETDVVRPLTATAFGRAVTGLLDLALGQGDRTTASQLLLGPYSDVDPETASVLDAGWRRRREADGRTLLSDISRTDGSRLAAAARAVTTVVSQPAREDGKNWQRLVDLLNGIPVRRLSSSAVPDASTAAILKSGALASRATSRLIGEMLSVQNEAVSAIDVRRALADVNVGGTSGERPGTIQVTELGRLGSRRFDTVIIAGLTADEAPLAGSSGLREEIRELVTGTSPISVEQEVRFRFYQAISRARRKLVLVRRDADGQGRALRPSVLWEEVVDAYRQSTDDPEGWPSQGPVLERLSAVRIAESAPVFTQGRRAQRIAATSSDQERAGVPRGKLSEDVAGRTVATLEVFSATEIEDYLACPYRWFYQRVVRPEELDRELDARAIGTLAHTLLSRFYQTLSDRTGERRVTIANLSDCRRLLASIADQATSDLRTQGLAEELTATQAVHWVEMAIEEDATLLPGFEPMGHEVAFADVELGGVMFSGRIDRIDCSDKAVFVTDYKTSRSVMGQAKFADEGKVQAMVYARAAEQLTALPCAGSVYRSLKTRELRGYWQAGLIGGALAHGHEDDSLGSDAVSALVEQTEERIAQAVAGIKAGIIPPKPRKTSDCAYCPVKVACEGRLR